MDEKTIERVTIENLNGWQIVKVNGVEVGSFNHLEDDNAYTHAKQLKEKEIRKLMGE